MRYRFYSVSVVTILLVFFLCSCPPPNPGGGIKVPVPNVVGMAEDAARSAITAAGLRVGTITEQHSDTVAVGYVISQNPAAGTQVVPNSAVNFVVSLGPTTVRVPNVVNMSEQHAEGVLAAAGLTVGLVSLEPSAEIIADNVMQQDPPADTSVSPGTSVNLVVSEGPSLKATFYALPSGGPAPLQVEFVYAEPLRESEIVMWSWDFESLWNHVCWKQRRLSVKD